MFQSSPGWLAGRCKDDCATLSEIEAFQSSPGWLAGRCIFKGSPYSTRSTVSILARLVGRALHQIVL